MRGYSTHAPKPECASCLFLWTGGRQVNCWNDYRAPFPCGFHGCHTKPLPLHRRGTSPLTFLAIPDSPQRDGDHSTWQRGTRTCLESMCAKLKPMRRLSIIGLALILIAAGLAPLSACAMLSSGVAECPQATSQSPCDHMHHHNGGIQLSSSSDKSCCVSSQAPLPELQFKGGEVGAAVTITVAQNTLAIPSTRPSSTPQVVENPSPPSFQSLLCTFLI
jgi:hypothetical protein